MSNFLIEVLMSLNSHLNSLIRKHNTLDLDIKNANDNSFEIQHLKKKKLKIKEKIENLRKSLV